MKGGGILKERVKQLRSALGLTQQKFADRLGLKRQTIAAYEIGNIEPSESTLLLICKEFGVNKDWMLTGNGEMYDILEDDVSAVVSDLLEEDNPFYDLIVGIMKTYKKLDDKSKEALKNLSKELLDNMGKREDN